MTLWICQLAEQTINLLIEQHSSSVLALEAESEALTGRAEHNRNFCSKSPFPLECEKDKVMGI